MTASKFWINQRVLVIGGAGFIGSTLVDRLVAEGANVTVIDQFITSTPGNLSHLQARINLLTLDMQDINWAQFLDRNTYEAIFHLAGNANVLYSVRNPSDDFKITLESSFRLIDALRENEYPGVLIYPSSGAVYGNPQKMPIADDCPVDPISPYGVAKLAIERYISVYSRLYGLRAASIRLFSAYGARQKKQVIYDLIQKIRKDPDELLIYGDGSQTRDFIHVEDIARAMMLIVEHGQLKGETYNGASGHESSIKEIAEMLCRIMQVKPHLKFSGSVRPGEPDRWSVNIQRLIELGFQPKITLEDGLMKTVEWVNSSGDI